MFMFTENVAYNNNSTLTRNWLTNNLQKEDLYRYTDYLQSINIQLKNTTHFVFSTVTGLRFLIKFSYPINYACHQIYLTSM